MHCVGLLLMNLQHELKLVLTMIKFEGTRL